jgi:hypothetical protein
MSEPTPQKRNTRVDTIYSWGPGRELTEAEYLAQLKVRFWRKVDKNGPVPAHRPELGPCWLWTGSMSSRRAGHNYGNLGFRWPDGTHKPIRAHVASFYLSEGRLPTKKMNVCHKCDNPPCVNPDHLWEGTTKANLHDAQTKGRMRVAVPDTRERALRVRLTPKQGRMLRKARKRKGDSVYDIGFCIGLDFTNYHRIETGERNGLRLEQLHFLLRYLEIDEETFGLKSEQTDLFGWPKADPLTKPSGGRFEPPARVKPKRPFQVTKEKDTSKTLRAWQRLPEPRLDYYRADIIRERVKGTGEPFNAIATTLGVFDYQLKSVLNGEPVRLDLLYKVLRYAGLGAGDVFHRIEVRAA